ncbi:MULTISPECIES: thioesterase family protein [unclassified Bradyrhizobium]|uniref:acyl-CoA thioesterase n=1 Tax=unclassified Bradyrhizobium TaxID=2631580 RepID=UPI001FF77B3D|nr:MULTISPECIES: thioesterase family protein [unclassified Bradyrhizobium]MCK1715116.1 acyl-CoA thioesterase [Bradyrhizobium sp. 143]MCK1730133.1 acyl-CoA thioesterase [Bradyrhizobium sp. 142]
MTALSFDRKLRFADCDPSGIAYFPSYLNMLNGVVEDFWAEIGFPWPDLITVRKIGTPTVHLTCDFSRPSMFGDLLTFKLRVGRVGRASLHLAHVVSGADGVRWRARQILAATSLVDHHAIPWSDDIRAALVSHLHADEATQVAPS